MPLTSHQVDSVRRPLSMLSSVIFAFFVLFLCLLALMRIARLLKAKAGEWVDSDCFNSPPTLMTFKRIGSEDFARWREDGLSIEQQRQRVGRRVKSYYRKDNPVTGFNHTEEEVVILKAVYDLIDSMVNFEMLSLCGDDPDAQILFRSDTHQRLFNIILADFLSQTDKRGPIKQTSYFAALKSIAIKPNFDVNDSIEALRLPTHEFSEWLNQEVEVDNFWLDAISTKSNLRIPRFIFLKMCGNICKHNFLRLVGVGYDLQAALGKSGITVTSDDALLILTDFYHRFGAGIVQYQSSTIAEFLNNLRWGIYEYLQPEFRRSVTWLGGNPPKYEYQYPRNVTAKFAKECYWDLMNNVRTKPYMRRFQVTKWLKLHH